MKFITYLFPILALASHNFNWFNLPAYFSDATKKEIKIKDINLDGFQDTIQVHISMGSGFGFKSCKIINGKTKEEFSLELSGSFAEIRNNISIPTALLKKENSSFKKEIEKNILPPRRKKIDASLAWILHALQQKEIYPKHKYFDWQINISLNWQTLPIELPESYFVEIQGNYLCYFGHNHFVNSSSKASLKEVLRNKNYIVFKTKHGILLQKEKQYAWIFVSDHELTGGPQKLRWDSIGNIELVNNQLIMELLEPPFSLKKLFVINLDSGKCSKLNPELELNLQSLKNQSEILKNN